MFRLLGQLVSRGWFFFLLAWILLLIATRLAAPPWREVAQDKEFAFLPADAPSRRSEALFARAFPDDRLASNVVLVLHRASTGPEQFAEDLKFISDVLEPGLRQIAESGGGLASAPPPADEPLFPGEETPPSKPIKRSIIARIRTPDAPGAGALLVSEDRQVLLVVLELTTEFLSNLNWPTLNRIQNLVHELEARGKVPSGMDVAITGNAVIGRDHTVAQLQSARATELLTMLLVIGLLIVIYRAPLLALIPLATVYLAVQLALHILALLARAGHVTLFEGIQIYITILSYGAGVDYCLFLTARCKEELDGGASPRDAVAAALRDVGPALVASAFTVIGGIGMMVFAQFGKFREAGVAIPLSLFLVLCASLSFSPCLLRLAGRWAFWPHRAGGASPVPRGPTKGFLGWFFHPGGLRQGWDKMGEILLRRPGSVWLATMAVLTPFVVVAGVLYHHLSYDMIGALPANAPSVVGTRVLREHFPAGMLGPVDVLLVNPRIDFSSTAGRELVAQLTRQLREQKDELGLADVRSLTAPLGITAAAAHAFDDSNLPREERQRAVERAALEHYVTDLGERAKIGTRLDLILESGPFSPRAVEALARVENALQTALPARYGQDSQLYLAGPTASVRDLQTVVRQDRGRIEMLVLVSVFLILLVLLRQLVVPVYLLLSVLFSYYATLGAAFVVFWLLDPQGFTGIDWKVAIFLFTILIAVGEDYNIFLMSRVREEQRRHGPVRGVAVALDRTGPIISSCGIIMAGTFASLLGGSLSDMKQLGFALAFGVLLDTFVVRPILVPAFLILLHSGRLRLGVPARAGSEAAAESGNSRRTVNMPS